MTRITPIFAAFSLENASKKFVITFVNSEPSVPINPRIMDAPPNAIANPAIPAPNAAKPIPNPLPILATALPIPPRPAPIPPRSPAINPPDFLSLPVAAPNPF